MHSRQRQKYEKGADLREIIKDERPDYICLSLLGRSFGMGQDIVSGAAIAIATIKTICLQV